MMNLFTNNKAQYNNFKIEPDSHLYNLDPKTTGDLTHDYKTQSTDCICLSSIQDSVNKYIDYDGTNNDSWGKGNSISTLKDLMKDLLGFTNVDSFKPIAIES